MNRYLYRVTYYYPDAEPDPYTAYEPVCVRAETETAARIEVDEATARWERFSRATKTLTLLQTFVEA